MCLISAELIALMWIEMNSRRSNVYAKPEIVMQGPAL